MLWGRRRKRHQQKQPPKINNTINYLIPKNIKIMHIHIMQQIKKNVMLQINSVDYNQSLFISLDLRCSKFRWYTFCRRTVCSEDYYKFNRHIQINCFIIFLYKFCFSIGLAHDMWQTRKICVACYAIFTDCCQNSRTTSFG